MVQDPDTLPATEHEVITAGHAENDLRQQALQAGEIDEEIDDDIETLVSVAEANVKNAAALRGAVDLLIVGTAIGLQEGDLKRQCNEKISGLIGTNHEIDEALDRLDPLLPDAELNTGDGVRRDRGRLMIFPVFGVRPGVEVVLMVFHHRAVLMPLLSSTPFPRAHGCCVRGELTRPM